MLGNYKFSRPTRRCAVTDEALKPGQWYYSVIFEQGDDFVRKDYSASAWDGLPENGIAFWKKRMPKPQAKKLVPAPPEVLVEVLRGLERFPDRGPTRYLLALTLMRRKVVSLVHPSPDPDLLRVRILTTGDLLDIPIHRIAADQVENIRQSLMDLLYAEEDSDDHGDDNAPLKAESQNPLEAEQQTPLKAGEGTDRHE